MPAIDLSKQKAQLEQLRDELGRLNQKLDEQKKALGLNPEDEVTVNPAEMTPELKKAMQAAREEAERAGRNAAATAKADQAPAAGCRRARRGSIAI